MKIVRGLAVLAAVSLAAYSGLHTVVQGAAPEAIAEPGGDLRNPLADGMSDRQSAMTPRGATELARPDFPRGTEPHASLHEVWLVAHGFPPGAARQRLFGLLNGRTDLPGGTQSKLSMLPSAHAVSDGSSRRPAWSAHERYVHATLAPELAAAEDSVILRWRRLDDGTVIELSVQSVDANSKDPLDVWMYRRQDWPPGTYRLEVVSANPRLELLAAGEFDIVPNGIETTAFAYPVGLDSTH